MDANRVGCAVGRKIEFERLAKPSDLDAHDRVLLCVEVGRTIEDLGGDRICLEALAPSLDLFGDDVAQKLALAVAGIGQADGDNPVQGKQKLLSLRYGAPQGRPCRLRHLATRPNSGLRSLAPNPVLPPSLC